jgi:hypothetical protein
MVTTVQFIGINAGTGTTFGGTNVSASMTINTAGIILSLSGNSTAAAATPAFSASGGSSTFQTLSFNNANGITFTNTGGSVGITHALQFTSATSAITASALNTSASRVINIIAATNNTGGGTASNSGNVSFSNANGLTFYTSAGPAIVGSYTVPTQTVQPAVGLNTAQSNVTWSVNSSGLSLDARGYAGTGTTFGGTNVSASVTLNSVGLNLALSGGAGTTNQTGPNIGVSNLGNTLGSTQTISTGNVVFAGIGGITLSQSTGAANSNATISISANLDASASAWAPAWNYSGMATNSSLGQSSLYFMPFDVGDYLSASRIQFYVSLSGALSAGNSTGTCSNGIGYALYTLGTGASTDRLMSLTSYSAVLASMSMNSNTQFNATHYIGLSNVTSHSTSQVGLTTSNASTYQATSINGLRAVNLPINLTLPPGRYWLGFSNQTVTGNAMTNGMSVLQTAANLFPAIVAWGVNSSATNASNWRPMQGFGTYSAQSGAWPATIPFTTDAIRQGVSQTMIPFNILGYATSTNLM